MGRATRLVLVLVIAMFAVAGRAWADPQAPALSVVAQDELIVEASPGEDTASTELLVVNPGERVPFKVVFRTSESKTAAVTKFSPRRLTAHDVTPIQVTLSGLKGQDDSVAGALVVSGGKEPVVQAASISPALDPEADWPVIIVIGSLVAMLALLVVILILAKKKRKWDSLGKPAPGPKWSFSSWATTMTATGAVFGTVLAAATFPESPSQIGKDTLVGLNLLFGALVVIAPFLFQALRAPGTSPADQESGLWGYNWALLLSCAITAGAVLGELGTLGLLAWELIGGGTWGIVALVCVAMLLVLATYYFAVTSWHLATTDWAELIRLAEEKAKQTGKAIGVGVAAGARQDAGAEEVQPVIVSLPPRQPAWNLP